jgi:hypothetical protein
VVEKLLQPLGTALLRITTDALIDLGIKVVLVLIR